MAATLARGSTFARYRIEGLVRRGGMGVVYRATDLELERPVALKLIAPDLAEDDRFRVRFLRESRVAASLDHRGVVPIYEAGEHEGQLFIAMRYVEGDDLKTLLEREGTLDPERTLSILGQVADALDAAHEKRLVHRDVKPANVLLDVRQHAYLTDFGLTKQIGGASTQMGQVVGTLDYLAPEQITGEDVDARTDCYSLACVLYECLAGRPPFRRETEAQVLWAHMQEEPAPLVEHPPLGRVFERGLAKSKEERYASCGELIGAAREAFRIGTAEGVATIMFTDVEGSTALATRLGDVVAKELIEDQRVIVRAEVAAHGGRVIDSIGDGFMVSFESTRRALLCALTLQDKMLERGRSDPARALRLRIGLNAGEVLERGGHPFGAAVNAAQRVAAVAKGGQVVASDSVRQLAGTIPGIAFRDRGRVRLKGFEEPRRLYEVVSAEGVARTPVPWRLRMNRRLALLAAVVVGGASAAVIVATVAIRDAGETRGEALPDPPCGEVVSTSLSPDVLIASDLTLGGAEARAENQPLADAIRFALRRRGFKAGDYTVGYQSCDNSSATEDLEAFLKKCGSNARTYARATRLLAVIGNLYSACAATQIPILNRAPGGPLVMISPGNTKPGLTRGGPGTEASEPESYYPTGDRNFFRVVPPDQFQGAAHATLAKRLRLRKVYVLHDGGPYGVVLATAFVRAARKLELELAGTSRWDPRAKSYTALADRVARSGADGVFLGGTIFEGGDRVIQALRARVGRGLTIMGGDGFHPVPDLLEATGPAARGMYVSVAGLPLDELGPVGLGFVRAFADRRRGRAIGAYAVEAAQAAEVALQAIARSDGTRDSVLREVRATDVSDGILGNFHFDRHGDITPAPVTIYRVVGTADASADVFSQFRGAVVDSVIHVPEHVLR
jgi:class 3 adenylate cyclase/ABC-type branched-subunit amino acid transport system substrate-binding protein/predicted Ser/Thr protein kinase